MLNTAPEPEPEPQPSTGGGSGGSSTTEVEYRPISLKLILPGPVSAKKGDIITLPIELYNDGSVLLDDINLSTNVGYNGNLTSDVLTSLSYYYVDALSAGQRMNLTLTATVNTELKGLYDLNIYANVSSPRYHDWGKIYLTVTEGETFEERIIFTEELIVSNPECAEIQEIVDEAKEDYAKGDITEADRKVNLAITSCKQAIEQNSRSLINNPLEKWGISDYILALALFASLSGFLYYVYKRYALRKAVKLEEFEV